MAMRSGYSMLRRISQKVALPNRAPTLSRLAYIPVQTGPMAMHQVRTMFIQTETTPNTDALKFIPGTSVSPNQTHEFLSASDPTTLSSPLATRLFDIPGVKTIFYGPDFISVNKESDAGWAEIKPEVFSVLMEHFSTGRDLFRDPMASVASDTMILDSDSDVVAMIKELLETRVRPAIMEDGGDIEYRGFSEDTGIVKLKLKGSCRGCESSASTLKAGIERMLTHYVPEVKEVIQVLDVEERVALDEFEKFEARLRQGGKTVEV